ncbi:PKD domain-containing protein [Methanococcoides seepicolus]|uniref:PKD domain-containing protein n=1 Tax=Methanococcoides seepicolus TaxID=2828780 RepID=A0A9E5DBT4_9EURY|nr:PKD domain-containing protein [Methanococcoides seepicolus]MCM1987177.1 PKD domain-containing protein [Methanococcoides seepicolus]
MIAKDRRGNLAFIMGILLLLLLMPSAVSASDWEQFQANKYNNGVTADKAPITYPVGNGISWARQATSPGLGAGFDSTFVVMDDILYVVGHDHYLRALYMENGTEKWATPTYGGGFQLGSIASGNGSIFVPTTKGMLFSINRTTGVVEWIADERIPYDNNDGYLAYQLNTPVVYDDHKIYFGGWMPMTSGLGYWCKYHCYYDNGTECWERNSTSSGGYYWSGAAIIDDYLVYGDEAGILLSVYKSNGTVRDEMDVSTEFGVAAGHIRSSVCYAEDLGRIYFTSEGGYIYSLGMDPDGTFNTTDKQLANIGISKSTPAVYKGRLYVGSGAVWGGAGSGLSCFNASNLSERFWIFDNATCVQSSPMISTAYDDGDGEIYIYFTCNIKNAPVYCINESGIEQWSYVAPPDMTEYTLQGVTISDGWLFYGNDNSYVFGFATPESLPAQAEVISITPEDSLQDTIYAAQNGDMIMMAPGTYTVPLIAGKIALYINKSGLTFMANGGEVIITPDAGDVSPMIYLGREDATDTTGCDASGITFKGITFGSFALQGDQLDGDTDYFEPNQIVNNMRFEGCTFLEGDSIYLYEGSSVLDCTFSGDRRIHVFGNNTRIEGNSGTGVDIYGGYYYESGDYCIFYNETIRNNTLSDVYISFDGEALVENNVFDGVTMLYLDDGPNNIIRNNEFLNSTSKYNKFKGQVYQNTFTNGYGDTARLYLKDNGTYYLNNFIGYTDIRLYDYTTFNTPTPVTYTYIGQEYTGYLGNYYSTYAGNDTDGNGVGEDNITSSYGGIETYPLMGAWDATGSEIEGPEIVPPVADFSANVASGSETLTVQFTDLSTDAESWSWDFDNDGVEDSMGQNPQFDYTDAGTYTVSLTVSNPAGSDTETKVDYIFVNDWNPWNDPDSEGTPDGTYVTLTEVIDAYNCFRNGTSAPRTGASIDLTKVIDLYNAFRNGTPM